MQDTQLNKNVVIIGLGQTGYSCVEFLSAAQHNLIVVDSRDHPPFKDQLANQYPQVKTFYGNCPDLSNLKSYDLVMSPGLSKDHPLIQPIVSSAERLLSDIDIFALNNNKPIIAITGSNAKSTVTSMVGEMAKCCGFSPAVVGNIGVPVLNLLLSKQPYDLVVMELSSFQLEITNYLKPYIATVLNISPDHLDRYKNFQEYYQAKHNIFKGCEWAVINKQDPLSAPKSLSANKCYFSDQNPQAGEFGLIQKDNDTLLCYGQDVLFNSKELKLLGKHNALNALSSLAIGQLAGFDLSNMQKALKSFSGLKHRCQLVLDHNQIQWINDSKGTNVGATLSALIGLKHLAGQVILILGGQAKGQDFQDLVSPIADVCKLVLVLGESQEELYNLFKDHVAITKVQTLQEAVLEANENAAKGDVVLFSPACASFDQFKNFEHRGDCFIEEVSQLGAHHRL